MCCEIRAKVIISLSMVAEEINSKLRELFAIRFQSINCFVSISLAEVIYGEKTGFETSGARAILLW